MEFFPKCQNKLYNAQKAMHALLARSCKLHLPIDAQVEMFDHLIMPILYGSEIWGPYKIEIINRLQLKYYKYLLNIHHKTTTCMVLGELGKY